MENLELGAIFTGSKFSRACMLMILMDSQTCTGKRQTTISRTWIAFRPPECESACPTKVGKKSRWRQRKCSSVEVVVVYAASKPDDASSESERMRSHSEWGKMLPSGASGEIKKKKRGGGYLACMLRLQWCQCCWFSPTDLRLSFCCSEVLLFCTVYERLPCEGIRWMSKQTGWKGAFYGGLPRREISLSINVVFEAGDFRKGGFKQSPLGLRITYTLFILMKLCIFTPRDCKTLCYHKSSMYIFYYCVSEQTWNLYSTSEKEPRSCYLLSGFVEKFNRTRS